MARTAISVIVAIVVVALAGTAAYVTWLRTDEPGQVVNSPVRESPKPVVRAAPPTPAVTPTVRPAVATTTVPPTPAKQPTPPVEPTPIKQPPPIAEPPVNPDNLPLVYHPDGVLGGGPVFQQVLGGIAVDRGRDLLYAVGDRTGIIWFDLKTGKQAGRYQTHRDNLCIDVDSAGAIYIGEVGRAEKYSRQPNGQWKRDFKVGDRALGRVTAIRVVGEQIACADAAARKIVFYNGQGQPTGRQIPTTQVQLVGKPKPAQRILLPNDTLDFQFNIAGRVVMAHPGRHEVQILDAAGKRLGRWGRFDEHAIDGFTGCCNPINVACFPLVLLGRAELTSRGQAIVTAEKGPPRVKVYDESGKLLALIDSKNFNTNNRRMYLAVDKQARIYVADTEARTIRRFAPKK